MMPASTAPPASVPASPTMVVFGIDPGSTVTGWGVVRKERNRLYYVDSGFIKTTPKTPMAQRLLAIHEGLLGALRRHSFDEVAIEAIFRHKSSESALRLGQARGVALTAAAMCGYEPHAYNPSTVKSTVGAHGASDKKAVARMVKMLLNHEPQGPADISDALAIAITHCMRAKSARLQGTR